MNYGLPASKRFGVCLDYELRDTDFLLIARYTNRVIFTKPHTIKTHFGGD